jgi:hypothetical protein
MTEKVEKVGGSLVNIILGALILWVGQTTFQHAGILATVDQKFDAMEHRFLENDQSHESTRKWLEKVSGSIKENNLTQFSNKDGDKLQKKIDVVDSYALDLERNFAERLKLLELKIVALETRTSNFQNENELRWEVAQLRSALAQVQNPGYQPVDRLAEDRPNSLPPVTMQQ